MTVPQFQNTSVQNPQLGSIRASDVPDGIDFDPVHVVAEDGGLSRALFYRPRGQRPRVGVHVMHPRADLGFNYNIVPMVQAGYAVLARASRWPNNDVATVHELLLLDVAAGLQFLRDAGCEQVVLMGNSGGSSLSAYYQAQAMAPSGCRLTETPASDSLDLNKFKLLAADGVAIIGGHVGQGLVLGKAIDPSVVDENDPLAADPALDIYNPDNGFVEPPRSSSYSRGFLERYREAQLARVRRLDMKAQIAIARQRAAQAAVAALGSRASIQQVREAQFEPHMIVYRTAADPAYVDLNIEPDGRNVTSYFSTQPHLENYSRDGFSRYTTPRAWLSTWSALSSRARTIENLAKQSAPLIIIHYAGDCGTRTSEAQAMYTNAASPNKQFELISGINHYGMKIMPEGIKGGRVPDGTNKLVAWLKAQFPVST